MCVMLRGWGATKILDIGRDGLCAGETLRAASARVRTSPWPRAVGEFTTEIDQSLRDLSKSHRIHFIGKRPDLAEVNYRTIVERRDGGVAHEVHSALDGSARERTPRATHEHERDRWRNGRLDSDCIMELSLGLCPSTARRHLRYVWRPARRNGEKVTSASSRSTAQNPTADRVRAAADMRKCCATAAVQEEGHSPATQPPACSRGRPRSCLETASARNPVVAVKGPRPHRLKDPPGAHHHLDLRQPK